MLNPSKADMVKSDHTVISLPVLEIISYKVRSEDDLDALVC
ncbi:hypothetical protein [Salibacterium sp. K-3]